ncbi:MAG: helix-hairpin-helix domain-containing protein [Candidatus Methanoperedens sp.]|nr:helix-hairpin-helix domain-containing protein [Candidatus Methanoperedens sp.]
MIKSLRDIPRIGEKSASRLTGHFGSENNALDAVINGDIAALCEVEGVTEKSAISLVQEAHAAVEGVGIRDFLKTSEAYAIYGRIIERVSGFAHTGYAKTKLQLYIPYPSNKKEKITRLQEEIGNITAMAGKLDESELPGLLSRIKPVKSNYGIPVIRDRAIITATPENFEAAKKFPVSVQLVSDSGEAADVARGYSHVIMDTSFAAIDFPEDINYEVLDIKKAQNWQVAPEKELAFFSKNLDSINSAISVLKTIRQYDNSFCKKVTDDDIKRLSSGLENLSTSSDVKSGVDSEIDRCQSILDSLIDVIDRMEKEVNLEFGRLIEKSSITIKGFDLLAAMDGSANRLFEKELRDKYNTVTMNTIQTITDELGLNSSESRYVNNFFGDEVEHPITINPRGVEGLKNHLVRSITSRKLGLLKKYARDLSPLKETASVIIRTVLDFDVGYTIGCFARDFSLTIPAIQDGNGIGIREGTNLFIEKPVPVNYTVGETGMNDGIGEHGSARVVLLSGVNSGGKTTIIDLLAQIIILSHMGFPVPAKECEVGLVDEFYYFGKSRGTMDAGAFESTIRDFSVIANSHKKIVLTDEMESITEPGASAKIISGILEELHDNNGLGVFVSHLAEAILENTTYKIRVDGIEASGLDENLNLIVDRNPRYNYLARSTPELIVERLVRKNTGNEFYKRLLGKFS